MSQIDAIGAWEEAQTEFIEALEEAQEEWEQASLELGIAVAAKMTPEQMLAMLSKGDQKVIEEVQRG